MKAALFWAVILCACAGWSDALLAGSGELPRSALKGPAVSPDHPRSAIYLGQTTASSTMRPLARLRGGGELIPLSLGQYWFIAVGSAFSIFIATSPRAFLDAYKVRCHWTVIAVMMTVTDRTSNFCPNPSNLKVDD